MSWSWLVAVACLCSRLIRLASAGGTERFASAEYWDEAYRKGEYGKDYEWYDLPWKDIRPYLESRVPALSGKDAAVLVSGCGNSPLSAGIAADGFAKRLVSVDVSSGVIDQMREKYPALEWLESDSRVLAEFADGTFDIVFDKGTLDALRGSLDESNSLRLFEAYKRVLRPGGVAVVVTSCMEDECMPLLEPRFDTVEALKVPKNGIEEKMKKARRAGYKGEIRQHDMMYILRLDRPKVASEDL